MRPDPHKPEIERMVTGDQIYNKTKSLSSSHERAVLESVSINLRQALRWLTSKKQRWLRLVVN